MENLESRYSLIIDNKGMKQLFTVVMGFVLMATIPTLIQTQVQAQGVESEPGALAHIKKIQDIAETCDEKITAGGSVQDSVQEDCMAVVGAFNQQMQQLFNQHKESIDHILYG